jgi:ubiquinone/menaquinone biosynthesis C-methylase UbiE
MASLFPTRGRVLDLGSGHGLLAFALSLGSQQREIIGIDHDPGRIRFAEAAALELPVGSRPSFEVGDLKEKLWSFTSGSLVGIAMIDILHYFDPASQQILISQAMRVLAPGGILAVREIDSDDGIRAATGGFVCSRARASRCAPSVAAHPFLPTFSSSPSGARNGGVSRLKYPP